MKIIDIAVRAFALLPYIYLIRELFRKPEEEPVDSTDNTDRTDNPYLIYMVREAKKRNG